MELNNKNDIECEQFFSLFSFHLIKFFTLFCLRSVKFSNTFFFLVFKIFRFLFDINYVGSITKVFQLERNESVHQTFVQKKTRQKKRNQLNRKLNLLIHVLVHSCKYTMWSWLLIHELIDVIITFHCSFWFVLCFRSFSTSFSSNKWNENEQKPSINFVIN